MRGRLFAALVLLSLPAAAQVPAPDAEAASHVFSAFVSRADPGVLADTVRLGPSLRQSLVAQAEGRAVYAELLERAAGKQVRVRPLPTAESARHATLLAGNLVDPVLALEAGELTLLMQYNSAQKRVTFVEQLAGTPQPKVEAKPQMQPEAPPAPVAAPAPAAVKKAAPAPPPPVAVQKPVPPTPAAPAAPPRAERPAPAAPAKASECVIKPVMSDDDLRACGVRR